jgi:RHS repeat-associated protein
LRHTVTDHTGATTTYGYDPLDRLTSAVTRNGAGTITKNLGYGYDAASNRTSETVNGTATTATFNAANQLTARGAVSYTYDGAGQQTGSSTGATYDYNTLRQTTSMRRAGGTAISAGYVGADQRQRATAAGETFTNTLLGVSVRTVGTAGAQHYVRDDTGGLVGIRDTSNGTRGYYLFDGLGSVAAITSATTAAVLNRYTYDPYGATTEQRLTGAMTNQWRYTGEYQDAATGLYKIGHRYLDTTLGRWTQQDPLLRAANPTQPAEANPYAYVGCNPTNYTDPSGLSTNCIVLAIGTGVVVAGVSIVFTLASAGAGASIGLTVTGLALESAIALWC